MCKLRYLQDFGGRFVLYGDIVSNYFERSEQNPENSLGNNYKRFFARFGRTSRCFENNYTQYYKRLNKRRATV